MKRVAVIALIVSLAIGLALGVYDITHPIMPDEAAAAYTDPTNWNSATHAREFWFYALSWGGGVTAATALVAYLPVLMLLALERKITSKH